MKTLDDPGVLKDFLARNRLCLDCEIFTESYNYHKEIGIKLEMIRKIETEGYIKLKLLVDYDFSIKNFEEKFSLHGRDDKWMCPVCKKTFPAVGIDKERINNESIKEAQT